MKNIFKKIITFILITESKLVLKKYKPKIIAVTGSVGKTSTKDAIYTGLVPFFHIRKSEKSHNSEIGIPLTILGLGNAWGDPRKWFKNIWNGLLLAIVKKEYPEWLILEIGADRPGEIEKLMKWIHPDISVITRIGKVPVHVEFYKSVGEVVKEKSFLARAVKKDGVLILNSDDEDVISFKEYSQARCITYGIEKKADIFGSYPTIVYDKNEKPTGMSIKVDTAGSSLPITINGVLGKHHMYPILACFAVASSQNLNLLNVADVLSKHEAPKGRMNIIEGIAGSTLIDDTYNASPIALEEGINIMDELVSKGKKIAILGDMLEIGKFSSEEHKRLGAHAAKVFDIIITVGIRAKHYAEGAIGGGMKKNKIYSFDTGVEAAEFAKLNLKSEDMVYLKGSQGVRMEKAVEALLLYPHKKEELLVRQEPEWKER